MYSVIAVVTVSMMSLVSRKDTGMRHSASVLKPSIPVGVLSASHISSLGSGHQLGVCQTVPDRGFYGCSSLFYCALMKLTTS